MALRWANQTSPKSDDASRKEHFVMAMFHECALNEEGFGASRRQSVSVAV
ncbi:hypothetical protein Tcan_05383 [Toxocara canis]|uniref:Uncharacterized protein n=1 Tax=Toxocara canis TaxID=6265 RepID=A0A0B2VIN4_TOXCA|nr:hypothetical protein Tcan_05383 [Toxocara canis]